MGDIIERRRRYYSGLDADKASIPAGGKAVADRFFATDTLIDYYWEGANWIPLGDDTILPAMLKTDSVETAKIKNLNVTVGKLAGGITAAKLATDSVETLKIKALNVTKGKAELGFGRYVPRAVVDWDWAVGDLTVDGNYHVNGLDCSAIVPAGAVAIHFSIYISDDAASSSIFLRANDTDKLTNDVVIKMPVANISQYGDGILYCDSDRLVDYFVTNGTDALGIKIVGWFI